MTRHLFSTLVLLFSISFSLSAQFIKVELVSHTDYVKVHHNGELVRELEIEPGNFTAYYAKKVEFKSNRDIHTFSISREGFETQEITLSNPGRSVAWRFKVKLDPKPINGEPDMVFEPWDYNLHLAKSAFAVDVNEQVAEFITMFPEDLTREQFYGTDINQFEHFLNLIPLAMDQQLVRYRAYLPDSLRPDENLEAFFHDSLKIKTRPEVILGAQIIDFKVTTLQWHASVTPKDQSINVTVRWYLFDPVNQKVVYQHDTQEVYNDKSPYRFETMEQAFTYTVGQAFSQLLYEEQFLTQTRRLGNQAIQLDKSQATSP
ncbi:MAG: hypothetical protein AAFQ98_13315 [Bacteroidota bacterium]